MRHLMQRLMMESSKVNELTQMINDSINKFSGQKLADVNQVIDVLLDIRNTLVRFDSTPTEPAVMMISNSNESGDDAQAERQRSDGDSGEE